MSPNSGFREPPPVFYEGVLVPELLIPQWDAPEGYWWRRGVKDARYGPLNRWEPLEPK